MRSDWKAPHASFQSRSQDCLGNLDLCAVRPIVGLLNNAGIFPMRATKNALGWDNAFATNHIGLFVLTEALIPHLPDGANVVFVASGVEDPERKPAKDGGLPWRPLHLRRGERARRVEATRIKDAGRRRLRHVKAMHRCHGAGVCSRTPRLCFSAVEPGFSPETGLGRNANGFLRFLSKYVLSLLALISVLEHPEARGACDHERAGE
jgi:NAD(P)-dependent dehydrogenase (short-subunit alcohol dehydrogenase family)